MVAEKVVMTITWVEQDVIDLAEERGLDPEKAVEAVRDSRRLLEERSVEFGWEVLGSILDFSGLQPVAKSTGSDDV